MRWLEGHVKLPVQDFAGDQDDHELGRPDAVGDGVGECPGLGLQLDPVGS